MAESIDLFFGMTGDGVVTSRINAMTRSFKGLERGYRTTSQLGKLANMGSKAVQAGSAIGAGRGLVNLLTPENLSLLSRYIVRPIKLDMRKLTRVIKPSFTKITDTISELSKKVFSKISETALLSKGWIKREIARTTIGAKGAALAGYIGGKFSSAKYLATKSIQNPSMIPMYASVYATIRRQRLESKLKLNKLDKFNIWTYRQIERIGMSLSLIHIPRLKFLLKNPLSSFAKVVGISAGFLQKNLRLYTGFGKVGEGFRKRLEVDANKLKNDIFRAYITNKRLLNFVGKKISSGISKSVGFIKGFLTNPWVLLASAIGLFFAATDRRLGAWLEKAISKVSSVIGKGISTTIRYNQIAIQSVSYMIKRGLEKMGFGFITPESKYSAPDVTQEIMAEMKKQNIVSPTNISKYIDEALRLYKDKFETNLDDYKKNLIDALNKQTEQRLKSIDDLLFTQYRESRL